MSVLKIIFFWIGLFFSMALVGCGTTMTNPVTLQPYLNRPLYTERDAFMLEYYRPFGTGLRQGIRGLNSHVYFVNLFTVTKDQQGHAKAYLSGDCWAGSGYCPAIPTPEEYSLNPQKWTAWPKQSPVATLYIGNTRIVGFIPKGTEVKMKKISYVQSDAGCLLSSPDTDAVFVNGPFKNWAIDGDSFKTLFPHIPIPADCN
jgi:hypothetical protein